MTAVRQVPDEAVAAEQRFLDDLRGRVAWQSEMAARLRTGSAGRTEPIDVLDADVLERLIAAHPEAPRNAEWRCFLAELRFLAGDDGRLPSSLERLVRAVLADLLEP